MARKSFVLVVLLLFVMAALTPSTTVAQDRPPDNNIISIHPVNNHQEFYATAGYEVWIAFAWGACTEVDPAYPDDYIPPVIPEIDDYVNKFSFRVFTFSDYVDGATIWPATFIDERNWSPNYWGNYKRRPSGDSLCISDTMRYFYKAWVLKMQLEPGSYIVHAIPMLKGRVTDNEDNDNDGKPDYYQGLYWDAYDYAGAFSAAIYVE